jgi:PKD repeat protein
MRRNLLLKRAFAGILFFSVCIAWFKSYTYEYGPGGGYANAPSESSCAQSGCHGGTVGSPGTNLTIDNGQSSFSYLPDSTYTITVTFKSLNSNTTMGFETTALIANNGSPAGTFTNTSSKTQKATFTVGGNTRQYIEHTSSGYIWSTGTAKWSFQWTAPSTNVGDVKFYVVVNDANGDGTDGGDKIYGNTFTMSPSSKLPVASITSSSNSACSGDSIQFFGASTNNPTSFKWTFTGANITSSSLQNPKVRFATAGGRTVTLTTTNAYGTSNTASKAITISNKPADTIGITGSLPMCKGSSVTLTAGVAGSYSWSNGATSQSITVKDTGTYFVTLSNGTCSINSQKVHVTYLPQPIASISANFKGDTICSAQPVTLTAPAGYKRYDFYNNLTLLKSDTAHSYTLSPTLSTNLFYVVIFNSGGCSDTSDTVKAITRPRLKTPVLTCGTSTTSSITMSWNAVTGAAYYQVSEDSGKTWKFPSSGAKGLSHTVTGLTFSESLALRVKAASYSSGCSSSLDGVGVCTTKSCSGITYDMSADTVICEGSQAEVNFSNISSSRYSIVLNNGTASRTTAYTFNPVSDTAANFKIYDSLNLGCPPVNINVRIRVAALPQFSLSGGNSTYCSGERVTVAASGSYPRYIFYKNGVKVQDSSLTTLSYSTDAKGGKDSLSVVAFNSSGCQGPAVQSEIIVHARPKPDFTFARQDTVYQFTDLSPEANGNSADSLVANRIWQFGDGQSSTDKSPVHHYAADGVYTVKLIAYNTVGCADSVEKSIDYKLGIQTNTLTSKLSVSPNPFSNWLELRFALEKAGKYQIRLLNSTGVPVINWQTYSLTQGTNSVRLNTADLPAGTYLVQVTDGSAAGAVTVIKKY